ncbi:MAG: hypothetical protein ACK4RK_08640 [Gemmataceae bacterium]
MKWLIIGCLLSLTSGLAFADARNGGMPPPGPKEWGQPADGLVAGIWIDQTQFQVGQPIIVHYQIKNVGQQKRTVWHSGFWPNHQIVVQDAAGQEVARTPFGQQGRAAFAPEGPREKNVPVELAPGQVDRALSSYNLRQLFVLDKPGKYTVQYLYQEGKTPVWSNVVPFEIVE